MVDSSSLVVLITPALLYGLVFLVAGVILLTVARNLQVGDILRVGMTCIWGIWGWGSREQFFETTQEHD